MDRMSTDKSHFDGLRLTQFEQYEFCLGQHDPTIAVGVFAPTEMEAPKKSRAPRVLLGIIGLLVFLLALLT